MTICKDDTVLVTGGGGFLGRHVVKRLSDSGYDRVVSPSRKQYDLREQADIIRLYDDHNPDAVIHLAATVGGIGANQANPGTFFYDNAIMGIQLIEYARRYGVRKFVTIGTVCSYPAWTKAPFRESELWNGYPEETNAPYGLAKRMLLVQGQAYRAQYDFNAVFLLMVNLFGPGDNIDPATSHVIPALIGKCLHAKQEGHSEIRCWGDGTPTREFLYVEDAAEAVILSLEKYDSDEPVNIGSGKDITIADLTELIASLTGFEGDIVWDASRPNGQLRRHLDVSRAKETIGFTASTDLETGLMKTIDWYQTEMGL